MPCIIKDSCVWYGVRAAYAFILRTSMRLGPLMKLLAAQILMRKHCLSCHAQFLEYAEEEFLENGDLNASPFGKLFLSLFVK